MLRRMLSLWVPGAAAFNTTQFVIQYFNPSTTQKARRANGYFHTAESYKLQKGPIKAPPGYNMGHIAASMLSENDLDRAQTNSFNNLTMQNARFNQVFWYGLELWTSMYCKEKGFSYFIICNLIILSPLRDKYYKIPEVHGFPVPYELAKVCFFINEDGTFENRNFIMHNDSRCQYWHQCEVTLSHMEDRFPNLKFLDQKTADPERFINKSDQQGSSTGKDKILASDPTVSKPQNF